MSDDPTTSHPTFQPVPPTSEPLPPADPTAPMSPVAAAPSAGTGGPILEPVRPVPAPPAKRRASSGRWLNVLLGVAVAVAIGGVAFAVGRSTAPAQAATFQRGAGSGNFVFPGGSFDPNAAGNGGANGGANGGFAGRFGLGGGGLTIDGTVDSVSADSITITTASGQKITLSLSGDTAYHTQTPASASDVTTGSKVAVQVQVTGGFRGNGNNGNGNGGTANGNGNNGNGNGNNGNGGTANGGAPSLRGTASDVTVIP